MAVWTGPNFVGLTRAVTGYDADLATGGALASGKVGFFDWHFNATAITRNYHGFSAYVPNSAGTVVNPDLELMLDHESCLREAVGGGSWGKPPLLRGGFALIPPAGDGGLTTRVVAKFRRNDIDGALPDDNIADSGTLQVDFYPRYLAPR